MKEILSYLPMELYDLFNALPQEILTGIKEIRLRVNMPIVLFMGDKSLILHEDGQANENYKKGHIITKSKLKELFLGFCEHSVHSFQNEIKNGFITINGGHRIGICGTCIVEDKKVVGIKDISSLNIRIARQINGISNIIFDKVFYKGLESVLIIGSPGSGKTTVIKDIARKLSNAEFGEIIKVAIIDERSEIAATHSGEAKNDIGFSADVYNLYPKDVAMSMALRSASPQVFICDEIGNEDDVELIMQSINTGVYIIATAHGENVQALKKRKHLKKLLDNEVFTKAVVLKNANSPGEISEILDLSSVQ